MEYLSSTAKGEWTTNVLVCASRPSDEHYIAAAALFWFAHGQNGPISMHYTNIFLKYQWNRHLHSCKPEILFQKLHLSFNVSFIIPHFGTLMWIGTRRSMPKCRHRQNQPFVSTQHIFLNILKNQPPLTAYPLCARAPGPMHICIIIYGIFDGPLDFLNPFYL